MNLRPVTVPCAALLLLTVLSGGCVGIVPVSTRTQTSANEQVKGKVKANFIAPGQSTRADVLTNLRQVDAGVLSDHFFVARWSSSNKAGWLLLCGYIDCMGGGSRLWKTSNAVVEFNQQNTVTQYAILNDSQLIDRLSLLAQREEPVAFNPPTEVQVEHVLSVAGVLPATLVLSTDDFELQESGKEARSFRIRRRAVARVRMAGWGIAEFPKAAIRIDFSEKTRVGKSMTATLSVADLFVLLKFVNQHT